MSEFKCKPVYLGLFSIVLSLPVYADWYFRGTPNNWDTTLIEQVGDSNVFKTCQRRI